MWMVHIHQQELPTTLTVKECAMHPERQCYCDALLTVFKCILYWPYLPLTPYWSLFMMSIKMEISFSCIPSPWHKLVDKLSQWEWIQLCCLSPDLSDTMSLLGNSTSSVWLQREVVCRWGLWKEIRSWGSSLYEAMSTLIIRGTKELTLLTTCPLSLPCEDICKKMDICKSGRGSSLGTELASTQTVGLHL